MQRIYQLVVEEELDDSFAAAFGGMNLSRASGNTVLTGLVQDQAHLQGLLQRVSSLGLTLLSARAIEDQLQLPER